MRYDKDHKGETRQRIVKAAAERFRREGIAPVGVASLMADAGLTHGGFYAHFSSKEDLVGEACAAALADSVARMREHVLAQPPGERTPALIRAYLNEQHRDEPEQGCAIAALGPELARHTEATRHRFTGQVQPLLALAAEALQDDGADPAQASAIVSILVGAMVMARSMDEPAQSAALLKAGRKAALTLASLKPD